MALNAPIKTKDEFHVGADRGPPLVYLDLGVGDQPSRRLHIELFHEELPITTENFRLLCTGECLGYWHLLLSPDNLSSYDCCLCRRTEGQREGEGAVVQ